MSTEHKHTPGPWRISEESPLIVKVDNRMIGSKAGELIASAMGRDDSGFYASESEALANSLLIPAAPDLLALAERFLDEIEQDDFTIDLHVAFRAAIAKATGRESA